jgi:signal transduction histidine kinase
MITIHDKNFNIIFANTSAEKNLKLPSSSSIPLKCFKYFHGTGCPPEKCPSCDCLITGVPANFELFEPHLKKHIEIRALPRFNNRKQIVGVIHIVRDISERKKSEKKIRDSQRQLRNLTSHLLSIRERDRECIAREIHDELAQSLTAMHMDLKLLEKKLPRGNKSLHERTRSMSEILDTVIQRVQKISSELRPKILDELGLLPAITWQARKFENRTGIKCEVLSNLQNIKLDQNRDTDIFRIFQETITNIYRHAKATSVEVSIEENIGQLMMKIKDNGTGIRKAQIVDSKSLGLIGMRERVQLLQGKIEIQGIPNKGTTVSINVPLAKIGRKNNRKRLRDIRNHEIRI